MLCHAKFQEAEGAEPPAVFYSYHFQIQMKATHSKELASFANVCKTLAGLDMFRVC